MSQSRKALLPDNDINDVFEHIWKGGYIDVQNATPEQAQTYYQSYLDNYLVADAVNDEGIKDVQAFKRFIRACAALVGNLVNYRTLGEAAGISEATAKKWLAILQDMDVVYLLEPYSNNELAAPGQNTEALFLRHRAVRLSHPLADHGVPAGRRCQRAPL